MVDYEYYKQNYNAYSYMRDNVRKDNNRLRYHLMPPTGWLNDPNGLCQKDGTYHIYFQFSPFSSSWDIKLWGHYTTKDMINFKEEEPFLFPDIDFDRDGVYSGSAFVKDNNINYFYTGNVKLKDKQYDYINEGREQNIIHISSKDGIFKTNKKLIMTNNDFPKNMTKHVRDPKIYFEDDIYYMSLGARDKENRGCIILYKSIDLENFKYYNTIYTDYDFGYMWECPDIFKINNNLFLLCCPQGVEQQGDKYQNIYQNGYFKIDYDFIKNEYNLGDFVEFDKGFDFYATQTFQDEKGRRILYAWMGIPDADYTNPTTKYNWQHSLTMPRQLIEKDGRLYQKPLDELKSLRKDEIKCSINKFKNIKIEDICFEMNIEFLYNQEFNLQIRDDVFLIYKNNLLTLSLGKSGYGRDKRYIDIKYVKDITIFSDTSSLEIFINDGEYTMTTRVYSIDLKQQVKFLSENKGNILFYYLDGYNIEWR